MCLHRWLVSERIIPGNVINPLPIGSCTDASVATAAATLPACSAQTEGSLYAVIDSTANTFGSPISGGGPYHVKAYCNGSNWIVN
jgi:hypothetical protein